MSREPFSLERPPVVELVLGLQFRPIKQLSSAHLGLFWQSLGDEWVNVTEAPQLDPEFERFGPEEAWRPALMGPAIRVGAPGIRLQFRNEQRDRMVQIQNGRLLYNWLRTEGATYPRYDQVSREFEKHLDAFQQFLSKHQLGALEPEQWEVTYVDHIRRGTVWDQPADWGKLLCGLPGAWEGEEGLPLESFQGNWHFRIAPEIGRVHLETAHGRVGGPQGDEALILKWTARGSVESIDDLSGHMDAAHESVVRLFFKATSQNAHAYWGKKS